MWKHLGGAGVRHTDCDWLYSDSLFNVRACRIFSIEALEHLLAAKGVDESGASYTRSDVSVDVYFVNGNGRL